MKCQPVSLDLQAFCRRVIAEVSAATSNGCAIEFAADGLDGEALVDDTLTGIILTNLLSNAVKYSRTGMPVRLRLRRQAHDAVFEIRDEGIGIPATDQANLFKSFHRGANVGNVPGTGLGLTIVKRCVDLHGGSVTFVSVEGQGTSFTVRLPSAGS
jgi:signal transduction histidine kinase